MNLFERTQSLSAPQHPTVEQLNAFAIGQLTEDACHEIERHVAVCSLCSQALAMSPNDSFVALLQQGDSLVLTGPSSAASPSRALRAVPGYTLLELLGEGGMGVVWKAKQEGLNRLVALKRLRGAQASAETLARFRCEAEAAARLQHPNIVQIYDVGEQDGEPYLALEYVGSGSLADRLTAGPLLPRQAAMLVETLARAMHYAHEHGIIHRDLKPANVLLASGGRQPPVGDVGIVGRETGGLRPPLAEYIPKISDFGLAKRLDEEVGQTRTGVILGTPSYMAPEQAVGDPSTVGPLADVYALGAILYELLTGRPPFRAPTVLETLAQVREREPVSPRQLQPNVPRDLQTICLKCLHKEARGRYDSALALAEDLRRFSAGEPIRARPVGRLVRLLKWMRRKPYQAVLAVVLCLIPLGAFAGLLWHNERLQAEKNRVQSAERFAQDNYAKSRQTLLGILDHLGRWDIGGRKNTAQLNEKIVRDALDYMETVLDKGDKNDPRVRADAAHLLVRIGQIQGYYGRREQAYANFVKALTLWEQLSSEYPEDSSHRISLTNCYRSLYHVGGDERQQLVWLEKAVLLAEEQCRLEPDDDLHLPSMLSQCHHDLATALFNWNRLAKVEEHYQQAIRLMTQVIDRHPEQSGCKLGLADNYGNLGLFYHKTKRVELAENAFQRAEQILAQLLNDGASSFDVATSRSCVALNWGNLYLEMGQIDKALMSYDRGIAWSEDVQRKDPTFAMSREMALKLHGSKANTYDVLKRFAEAASEWKRVVELAEGPIRLQYRMRRSASLARNGDFRHAVAEADALVAEPDCSPDIRYDCACVLALSGRSDNAIALLNKLRSNGYFDKADKLKTLQTDADLDSLRHRHDFIELLNATTHP